MSTTIPQLKHQFLIGQVRILNAPLDPPDEWRDAAPKTKSGNLSQAVVDEVLVKANRILQTHNANCFPPMVLEHVAAQIDALYWSQTTTAAVIEGEDEPEGAISLDADLRDDGIIASLPRTLPNNEDHSSPATQSRRSVLESDDLTTRYSRLRRSVQELSAQRQALEARKAQAKALLELLAPFKDPDKNVQRNLLVEDSELAKELARMKELLAKVNRA